MKYSCFALFTLCMITGCAHKQRVEAKPGVRMLEHCREVSINAKTGETTVICPPQEKGK